MKDLTLRDLSNLITSDVPDAESKIETLFDWQYKRDTLIIKWVLGLAASLAIAILVSIFKVDVALHWSEIVVLGALPVGASTYGFYRLKRSQSINKQFIATLTIYGRLKQIKPFLSLTEKSK